MSCSLPGFLRGLHPIRRNIVERGSTGKNLRRKRIVVGIKVVGQDIAPDCFDLSEDEPKIDAEIEVLTEDEATTEQERIKRKWATAEALVGSEKRLAMVAADLMRHF